MYRSLQLLAPAWCASRSGSGMLGFTGGFVGRKRPFQLFGSLCLLSARHIRRQAGICHDWIGVSVSRGGEEEGGGGRGVVVLVVCGEVSEGQNATGFLWPSSLHPFTPPPYHTHKHQRRRRRRRRTPSMVLSRLSSGLISLLHPSPLSPPHPCLGCTTVISG